MLIKVRVVAVNPEKQTVDILSDDNFQALVAGDESTRGFIERNIPYISLNPTNISNPYIAGSLASIGVNQDFHNAVWEYGQSFVFGRTYNPVYLKFVNEYYVNKGTNIKAAIGGQTYRPNEGSLAIYDNEARIILGFVGDFAQSLQSLSSYGVPDVSINIDEFSTDYINDIKYSQPNQSQSSRKKPTEILRYLHSSLGYDPELDPEILLEQRNRRTRKTIDKVTGDDFFSATIPHISPYIYKQEPNLAHPEELSPQYIRFKQNNLKRINDIYSLGVNNPYNRATIKTVYSALTSTSRLFPLDDSPLFNHDKQFVSIRNIDLSSASVYKNFYSWADKIAPNIERLEQAISKDVSSSDKFPFKEYAYEGLDVHIAPESGMKQTREGGYLIYSDVSDSLADMSKPLRYEEYIAGNSSFYNDVSEYAEYISEIVRKFIVDNGGVDDTTPSDKFAYSTDLFSDKTPNVRSEVTKHAFDDRGSYLYLSQEFCEISSDTTKGGWLLEKSNKHIVQDREYYKQTVFMPYDAFTKIINERSLTNPPYLNFEHKAGLNFEIYNDDRIREGTYSLEAPLTVFRNYREYHSSMQSVAFEVKNSDKNNHRAGLYLGTMSTEPDGDNPIKGAPLTNTGGYILMTAGQHQPIGGSLEATQAKPQQTGAGIIELEAGEIRLNSPRIMIGQIRIDQREKLNDLALGTIILAVIPMFGSIASKIGDFLREVYPVRNPASLENIL